MENLIYKDKSRLKSFLLVTKVVSLIFIGLYTLIFIFLTILMKRPAAVSEYISPAICSIYLIGLLISLKRHGLGALISSGFVVIAIVYLIFFIKHGDTHILKVLVLFIPCILNFLSWYFLRKLKTTE